MENGESSLHGAIRETQEEAGASVIIQNDSLYTLFNLPKINQVYMFFRAELANLDYAAGLESEEVALFMEREIPWQEIAFPVVKSTLEHYFEDLRRNRFPVRMFDVHHGEDRSFTTVPGPRTGTLSQHLGAEISIESDFRWQFFPSQTPDSIDTDLGAKLLYRYGG